MVLDAVSAKQELNAPVVDLEGFFKGDVVATENAAKLIRSSCLSHGFFQVTNHKVDADLIQLAYDHVDHFLNLPIEEKIKDSLDPIVANYFEFTIGKDFKETWLVYQKYSEAMHGLALSIMELLAIGLGVDWMLYIEFFEDAVRPIPGALVINIGDVFAARVAYREVVNSHKEGRSLVFFMCPRPDKLVKPAEELVRRSKGATRKFPDFTWYSLKIIAGLMKLLSKTSPTVSFLLIIPIPNPPIN
ncbi:unnamed protein product [Prunus armeniaca]|uniref:Non-haem dioxygenase N-terminal domain-containing protein n=1 Tax=Prunus armeniaca TaxID=36596 RepID=A0A6J5WAY1_PRUAR|nr:unnamed protein product [Prunus armeniaca]